MKRSVVLLMGRLGNQLFQYSFARWLETQGHQVRFDVSSVRREGVADPLQAAVTASCIRTSRFWPTPLGRFGEVASLMRRGLGPGDVVLDTSTTGARSTGSPLRGAWWAGYWQQERFARVARDELGRMCAVPDEPRAEIAVHVRRGDFVDLTISQDSQWYARAVREASRRMPGAPVRVVSDDPQWCQQELNLPDVQYTKDASVMDDFRTLAQSRLVVASASTFSWWACYLGQRSCIHPPNLERADLWNAVNGAVLD